MNWYRRASNPIESALLDLEIKYSGQLYFQAYQHRNDGIVLSTIQVRKDAPKGTGTAFMTELSDIADQFGIHIFLTPQSIRSDDKSVKQTTSEGRLRRFYRRFKFRPNKATGRFDFPETWNRSPDVKG